MTLFDHHIRSALDHHSKVDGALELEADPVDPYDAVNLQYFQQEMGTAFSDHEGVVEPEGTPAIYYRMGFQTAFVWWEGFADQVSGHGYYTVYISTDPGFATLVGDPVKTKATWTVFTGLDNLTTYYFKVCAISASGEDLGCVTDQDTTTQITNDDIEWVEIDKLRAGQLQVTEWISSSNWDGGTDYTAGTQGWFIDGAGNVSFNNGIFRGDLDVSNIIGNITIQETGSLCTTLDANGRQLCIGDIHLPGTGVTGQHRIGWKLNISEDIPAQIYASVKNTNGQQAPQVSITSGYVNGQSRATIVLSGQAPNGTEYLDDIGLFARSVQFQSSTQVRFPSTGTTSAPPITFIFDEDTGFLWGGSGTVTMTSDGDAAMSFLKRDIFNHGFIRSGANITGIKLLNSALLAEVQIRTGDDANYAPIRAAAYGIGSSQANKMNITDVSLPAGTTFLKLFKDARPRQYQLADSLNAKDVKVGLVIEELPSSLSALILKDDAYDLSGLIALMVGALREIANASLLP